MQFLEKLRSKNQIILIFIIGCFILTSIQYSKATSLNEEETISLLTNNPDTLIIDIRWQDIYNEYHLRGAILVANSNPYKDHQQAAEVALQVANQQTNYNYSQSILVVCNCPVSLEKDQGGGGTYASDAAEFLETNGYTDVYHFYGSFSTWENGLWLVSGSNPDGPPATTSGEINSGGDNQIILILGVLIILGGSGGFIFYAMRGGQQQGEISKVMVKSDQKKREELQKLNELVKKRKTEQSQSSVEQKRIQTRRR